MYRERIQIKEEGESTSQAASEDSTDNGNTLAAHLREPAEQQTQAVSLEQTTTK